MTEVVLYRPSNGTEGDGFFARWCAHCAKLGAWMDGEGCQIVANTFALTVDDPDYPREWREDGPSGPHCTAFAAAGDVEPLDPTAVIRPLL